MVVRAVFHSKKEETPLERERRTLLEGLEQTRVQLNQARACFNQERDPDLIESYVFEINALRSRYSYFLRRVRELGEQEGEMQCLG